MARLALGLVGSYIYKARRSQAISRSPTTRTRRNAPKSTSTSAPTRRAPVCIRDGQRVVRAEERQSRPSPSRFVGLWLVPEEGTMRNQPGGKQRNEERDFQRHRLVSLVLESVVLDMAGGEVPGWALKKT